MADPQTLQAVVTTLPELAGNQPIQKIALFSPDGTPWPGVITPDAGAGAVDEGDLLMKARFFA